MAEHGKASRVEARDFDSFAPITQELILLTAQGSRISAAQAENPSLIRLAENLRHEDAITEAANQLLKNESLFWSTHDFLLIIRDTCLRAYHEESYLHLMRVLAIFHEIKKFWLSGQFACLNREAISNGLIQESIKFSDEEWLYLEWACAFHDFCKMAYDVAFWDRSGKFTQEQRLALHPHARWFYYLGEMFNVPKPVAALAVLHHFLNHGYPDNGVVKENQHFLDDPRFVFMLKLVATADIYEAMSGERSYRQGMPHEYVIHGMLGELTNIGPIFIPHLEMIKETDFPSNKVICPISQCA